MVLFTVLNALWRMLEPNRRFFLTVLVGLQFLSGLFEMTGMLVIFGFIRGLRVTHDNHRAGGVGRVLTYFFGHPPNNWQFALYGGLLVISVILVKNVQGAIVRFQVARFLSNLNHRIAMQLFAAFVALPYEDMVKVGESSLQNQLSRTLKIFATCFGAATHILSDATMLSMVVALLLYVDVHLTLLAALVFGGAGVGVYMGMQNKLRRMGRAEVRARTTLKGYLSDGFGGIVEARMRDSVRYFQGRYGKALAQKMRVERRRSSLGRIPASANELLLTLAIVGSVLYMVATKRELNEALPVLAIFGFAGMRANGAMSRINRAFQTLRQKNGEFEELLAGVSRLAPKVMGSSDVDVPTYLADERPLPPGRDGKMHASLQLNSVSFTYPGSDQLAIDGVSLTIERGQFVSFCGESGGGKSTLIMLLMGLLRPTQGVVSCDDWNVHEHIRVWHRNIGYVGQAAYISATTVRQNVAFGIAPEKIDDAKVWAAIDLAAAREFVEALPKGLDTELRGRGLRLSGGQRQRIIIARALYHDPDVVVFDEATAALDNVTEQAITEAAVRLSRKKTVICIAHRLSTIRDSDTIHLVHRGKVVASGSYDILLETSEAFRRLARAHPGTTHV
jgi:ABC-type multidrug transport system fused ATPase/permease subunit